MAFSLAGLMAGLGRMAPGYMNGYRQAITDNWQDLQNYNNVQAGQIGNAFNERVFDDAVAGYDAGAINAANNALLGSMTTAERVAGFPMRMQNIAIHGYWDPQILNAGQQGAFNAAQAMSTFDPAYLAEQIRAGQMPAYGFPFGLQQFMYPGAGLGG